MRIVWSGRQVKRYRASGHSAILSRMRSCTLLVAHELGAAQFWQLPSWINEGYADYVAKGADFSYEQAAEQLRRCDREMSPELSGLYLRYHLLVAHLLDKNGISIKDLLAGKYNPDQIEDEILANPSAR